MTCDISIIIVNYNRCDLLQHCLGSIFDYPCHHGFEIIVVDNASTDNSTEIIEQKFKNIKLIKNRTNKGFAAANNQALRQATGKFILFLNSDTIVLKNSIDILAEFLEKNPQAGLCAPKLLNPDGSIQPNVYRFATFRSILARYTIFKYFGLFKKARDSYKMRGFSYDRITEIDRPMGAAMMAVKTTIEKINDFDENFFFYFEDADLCLKLKKAGFKIYFIPDSKIIHVGRASSGMLASHKTDMIFYRSMFTYFRKHRGRFNTFLFSLIFKPGALLYYIANAIINFITAFILFGQSKYKRRHRLTRVKTDLLFLVRFLPEFLMC
jgi:GT2 family glycosyltransferase